MSENNKNNGQFKSGNEIGKDTRFKISNKVSDKYKDSYCYDLLLYFLKEREATVYCEKTYYKDGQLKSETPKIIMPPKFPTFEAFAVSIGVTPQTLINWTKQHPRFLIAYERAKTMQKAIAVENGVGKLYDANFTKFFLINDHGMTDKVVQEQTQDKPFEVNINVRRPEQK